MKDNQPLVSVIAVCFNQSRFVIECLESIGRQTYQNVELIIVDDCSQDDSVAVIRSWLDATQVTATFIAHTRNRGLCKTLNDGLARATGKYVSIIAGDDLYLPNKIEVQVELFEKLPASVGVVYSDALQIDQDGTVLPRKFIEAHRELPHMPEGQIFPILLQGNFIPAMTVLIRRQCFDAVGPYDETLLYEDFDMWLRISRRFRFSFSPVISAKYRILPTSMMHTVMEENGWATLRTNFRIFEKCLQTNGLTSEQRTSVGFRLKDIATRMYVEKCKGRNYYLWKLVRHSPRKYSLAIFLFSTAAIPFAQFSRLLSWWESRHKKTA
jgi:glycosyltransferase involved in cell wall biosynthesis